MREVTKIDSECGDYLQQLYDIYNDPFVAPKHFNRKRIIEYLKHHPNGDVEIQLLCDGFPLHLVDRDTTRLNKNISNICGSVDDLRAILKCMLSELKDGYIRKGTGHYQLNLLVVPKKDNVSLFKSKKRVARHGSYSTKSSVAINTNISAEESAIPTLPNIRKYIQLLIQYDYVSLRDLRKAFRQLLLHKSDVGYIQYCIFGMSFTDLRQAYGVRSAAANMQHFARILIWILENYKLTSEQKERIEVHIDDFIFAGDTESEAIELAEHFDKLCDELNVQISVEKNEDGIQKGIVHEFGFNLANNPKTVHIPSNKMLDILNAILLLQKYRYADGIALEALSGKMMHYSQFRKQSKMLCFRLLRKIHERIRKNPRLRYKVFFVPDMIMRDLVFWTVYMSHMRNITMESILYMPSITITASTDASEDGGAYVIGRNYAGYRFSSQPNEFGITHKGLDIDKLEAHAVIMLLHNHRHDLTGRQVLLYVDNKCVLFSMYRNWSGSVELMEYIQEIVMIQCVYNIGIHIEYIPSEFNKLSDSLSRFNQKEFDHYVDVFDLEMNDQPDELEYYESLRYLRGKVKLELNQ